MQHDPTPEVGSRDVARGRESADFPRRGVLLIGAPEAAPAIVQTLERSRLRIDRIAEVRLPSAPDLGDEPYDPAVVFLDLEPHGQCLEEVVGAVQARFPHSAVVGLTDALTTDGRTRLLLRGVPVLDKTTPPSVLAALAVCLSTAAPSCSEHPRPPALRRHFEFVFLSYVAERVLSRSQQLVLRLYLEGKNDKEIAELAHCSEATVYEHWRRMTRKVGGSIKSDVVADFHSYLAGAERSKAPHAVG